MTKSYYYCGMLRIPQKLVRFIALILGFYASAKVSANEIPEIHAGYYIKSIQINNKEEKATIDFYFWYRFEIPSDSSLISTLKSIEFVNGDIHSMEFFETKTIGKEHYVQGRAKGDFRFEADYSAYPFDKQIIPIQLEHSTINDDKVRIVVDSTSYLMSGVEGTKWGLPGDISLKDMIFEKALFTTDSRLYNSNFGDLTLKNSKSKYSRMTYSIYVQRISTPYMLKFLIPLIIILGLAYLVFFIEAENLDLACGLTVTSLLAAIAFQWTVSDDLPNIGYLTCQDKIFYLGYILIMLAMVQTVWTYHLQKNGKDSLVQKVEIGGRWLYPIIFIGGLAYFILSSVQ